MSVISISEVETSVDRGPLVRTDVQVERDKKRELVTSCWDQAVRAREQIDKKRLRWWKNYYGKNDPIVRGDTGEEIKTLSNLFMPWTYAFIEQRVPRVIGRMPSFTVTGQDQEFDQEWSEAIQQMLRYDLDRAGYFQSAIIHIKQAEIFGWSVRSNFWRYEEGWKHVRKPVREPISGVQIGTEVASEKAVKFDDPWTEVIDIWRCYTQPGALSIESADWFIHESILSRKAIVQRVRDGVFDKEQARELLRDGKGVSAFGGASTGGSAITDNPYWAKLEALGFSSQADAFVSGDDHFPRYRILTFWTGEEIVTVAEEKWVLRARENPYGRKPYRELKVVPVPFMQEGIGSAQVIQDLQKAENVNTNQRIDAINLAINKVLLGPDDACDWDKFVMTPGNRVPCEDFSRIKFLDVPAVGADSYQQERLLMESAQMVTGVNDYIAPSQGNNTRLNKTARGVEAIQEQSGVIFSLIAELFDLQDVGPTAVDFYTMRQRFQDRARVMRVLGKQGYSYVRVTPDDLMWTPDIKPIGGSAQPQDKQEDAARAATIFQALWGNPIAMQMGIDQKKVLDNFLKANGERDPDRFYSAQPDSIIQTVQKEHEAMAFGQPVPPSGDAMQHLQLHLLFLQSPFVEQIPENRRVLLVDHIRAHQAKMDRSPESPWFERDNLEEAKQAAGEATGFGG